eukprot:scaffold115333_cov57-Phaeocystis_antarctica.AAC.3
MSSAGCVHLCALYTVCIAYSMIRYLSESSRRSETEGNVNRIMLNGKTSGIKHERIGPQSRDVNTQLSKSEREIVRY